MFCYATCAPNPGLTVPPSHESIPQLQYPAGILHIGFLPKIFDEVIELDYSFHLGNKCANVFQDVVTLHFDQLSSSGKCKEAAQSCLHTDMGHTIPPLPSSSVYVSVKDN